MYLQIYRDKRKTNYKEFSITYMVHMSTFIYIYLTNSFSYLHILATYICYSNAICHRTEDNVYYFFHTIYVHTIPNSFNIIHTYIYIHDIQLPFHLHTHTHSRQSSCLPFDFHTHLMFFFFLMYIISIYTFCVSPVAHLVNTFCLL